MYIIIQTFETISDTLLEANSAEQVSTVLKTGLIDNSILLFLTSNSLDLVAQAI